MGQLLKGLGGHIRGKAAGEKRVNDFHIYFGIHFCGLLWVYTTTVCGAVWPLDKGL